MDKLDLQTPDFTAANIARLAELFPNCATETRLPDGTLKRAIDFDLLRQELSHDLVEGPQERYRLDWPGKREALALANAPIRKTLRPSREESVNFDTTRNLYIEGDNLDALKLLQETYLGQVKMIYIDPPYNTGNDFIYDDNFSMNRGEYEELSGDRDEEGNAMFDGEKWKQNSSSNGRFHSEWLSMIYSRLKLAKNLLRGDGIILVSIDDGEASSLRKVCDEICGEGNFVGSFVWDGGRKNDARLLSSGHDYILCYARALETLKDGGIRWKERKAGLETIYQKANELLHINGTDVETATSQLQNWFASLPTDNPSKEHQHYRMLDSKGPWYGDNLSSPNYRQNLVYEYKGYQPPRNGWRYDKKSMERLDSEGLIHFPESIAQRLQYKRYLKNTEHQTPKSVFYLDRRAASKELQDLFSLEVFDFPKSHQLLSRLISIVGSPNDLILDFFSGSATTAHAVMQLNAEDGGNRRHIMVQLPETCDEKSEAFKAGYATIAEIGKERIRRAGKKIRTELEEKLAKELPGSDEHISLKTRLDSLDIGFRVLKVDSSNFTDVYYQPDELTQNALSLQVDNLKRSRNPEDLLFQVLLDWGVDLALPVTEEQIAGRQVFFVDGDALAACFDTGLDEAFVKALAARAPLRAVFRDAGYASDAVKINIEQIFKALSPHTELKTL